MDIALTQLNWARIGVANEWPLSGSRIAGLNVRV